MINSFLKNSYIYDLIAWYRHKKEVSDWIKNGRRTALPNLMKQRVLKDYSERFNLNILIETGTYMGFMVAAMKNNFKKIISIELSEELYQRARAKFSRFPHIEIIKGDSGQMLPVVLQKIIEPALFWLDAHCSGEGTARGHVETPIVQEIKAILSQSNSDHVILIDDAHCFTGHGDYPSLEGLKNVIINENSKMGFEVKDNIVRVHKTAR
jgi:hypothetical protein